MKVKSKSEEDLEVSKKLMRLYHSASSRGLEFNLTIRTVRKLLNRKRCFYTNRPFEESGIYAMSVDRVDNEFGYVEGNVVACTVDINSKKANLTTKEIEQIFKKTR
jgi:hypothetical protein